MPAARLINICLKLTKGRLTPHQIKISRLHTDYESPAKNYVNLAASLQTSHYPILMDCPPQYRANKTWEAQLVKKITSSHNCEIIPVWGMEWPKWLMYMGNNAPSKPQYRANQTSEAQLVKRMTSSHQCEVISVWGLEWPKWLMYMGYDAPSKTQYRANKT